MKLGLIKAVEAVFEDVIEGACTEGITCACGLDGVGIEESGLKCFDALEIGLGAVGSVGCEYERNIVFVNDHLDALVEVFLAGHKGDLIVGNL